MISSLVTTWVNNFENEIKSTKFSLDFSKIIE